jgi:hypothetical protein
MVGISNPPTLFAGLAVSAGTLPITALATDVPMFRISTLRSFAAPVSEAATTPTISAGGRRLGFSEPINFGKFCTRFPGTTPGDFRRITGDHRRDPGLRAGKDADEIIWLTHRVRRIGHVGCRCRSRRLPRRLMSATDAPGAWPGSSTIQPRLPGPCVSLGIRALTWGIQCGDQPGEHRERGCEGVAAACGQLVDGLSQYG